MVTEVMMSFDESRLVGLSVWSFVVEVSSGLVVSSRLVSPSESSVVVLRSLLLMSKVSVSGVESVGSLKIIFEEGLSSS